MYEDKKICEVFKIYVDHEVFVLIDDNENKMILYIDWLSDYKNEYIFLLLINCL